MLTRGYHIPHGIPSHRAGPSSLSGRSSAFRTGAVEPRNRPDDRRLRSRLPVPSEPHGPGRRGDVLLLNHVSHEVATPIAPVTPSSLRRARTRRPSMWTSSRPYSFSGRSRCVASTSDGMMVDAILYPAGRGGCGHS